MATNLGELIYTLTLNDAGFDGQIAAKKAQMDGMAAKSEESSAAISGNFNKLGIAAAAVAIGIGIVADKTIKAAGSYQAGITTLVTGAGENQKNIAQISKGLLTISEQTGTTTQQMIAGAFMAESAGYHGAAALDVMRAAAEGAKTGNADLGSVTDATTTIMKDFSGTLPTQAVNILIATVANGKTHMQDLADAMSKILPTASAAKVGLNDVMGAMATMTGEGVPAANAATYLRQMIIGLSAPTTAVTNALTAVGLTTQQVSDGMKKSLPDTLQMITDAVGKKFPVGSQGYMEAIKNISGGSKNMQAMLDLTGNHAKDFTKNVDSISKQVNEGGKSVLGYSKTQQDMNFKLEKAKTNISDAGIALGTALIPMVSSLLDGVVKIITPITNFITRHQKLAAIVLASIGVFGALVTSLIIVKKTIDIISSAWTVAKGIVETGWSMAKTVANFALTAAKAVVNATITTASWAASATVTAANWVIAATKTTASFVIMVAKSVASAAITSAAWVVSAAVSAAAWIAANLAMLAGIGLVLLAIAIVIAIVVEVIKHWSTVKAFFAQMWSDIKQWFMDGVNFIMAIFNNGVNFVKGVWSTIVGFFSSIISSITGAISRGVSGFGSMLWNAGSDLINGLVHGIEGAAGKVFDAVKNIGEKAVKALKGVLKIFSPSQVFSDLGSNISIGLAEGISNSGQKAVDATSNVATSVVKAGVSSTSQSINNNNSSSSGVSYNFAGASFIFSTKDSVDQFFSIGNRNIALEMQGGSPLAGTTRV